MAEAPLLEGAHSELTWKLSRNSLSCERDELTPATAVVGTRLESSPI
eukprot:CAMPEP_0172600874 /NCGR_PEP_ID=MMETSP1068-20121228/21034_1 /TAXON_ID=35684 /ORGANISM="Pseudopedinella elastica, Strain CCMP716" /LENGTH=46 /DNA_ID= /DNA_START= /DNA_END= /DNA_ORIENTATION=